MDGLQHEARSGAVAGSRAEAVSREGSGAGAASGARSGLGQEELEVDLELESAWAREQTHIIVPLHFLNLLRE